MLDLRSVGTIKTNIPRALRNGHIRLHVHALTLINIAGTTAACTHARKERTLTVASILSIG